MEIFELWREHWQAESCQFGVGNERELWDMFEL